MSGLVDTFPQTWLPRESISGNRPTIDPPHERVHAGKHFTAYHEVTVGTGTAASILFTTPAATVGYIHFVCSVESDKAVDWTFSEAPNASGGTAITSQNNNRNSSTTDPLTAITHTCTYTSSGTVLENHIAGTNQPATKLGGTAEARNEWLLLPETQYLIYAVAAAADTKINFVVPYYYR